MIHGPDIASTSLSQLLVNPGRTSLLRVLWQKWKKRGFIFKPIGILFLDADPVTADPLTVIPNL